jgi:alpha-1,6-mannosyltransferase
MRYVSLFSLLAVCALVIGSHLTTSAQIAAIGIATAIGAGLTFAIFRSTKFDQVYPVQILFLGAALRACSLMAAPLLEDDYFRYLWDAYRFAYSGTPYGDAPAAFFADESVPLTFQNILNSINYPDIPTIYGPVMQLLFLCGYTLSPGEVFPLQMQNAILDFLILVILARAGARPRWLLLYAISPLVLKESVMTAHPDGLVGLLIAAGFIASSRQRSWWAGGLIGLAVGAKVSAVILLPFLVWRGGWRALLASATVLIACYLPFVLMQGSEFPAFGTFALNWRFNPLLFAGIETMFGSTYARPMAALALGASLLWIYWHDFRLRFAHTRWPAVDRALGALLILAPVFNPWYLLWLLPFAVLRPSRTAWAATIVLPLSYWNSSHIATAGIAQFNVPWWVTLAEISVLIVTAWLDYRYPITVYDKSAEKRDQVGYGTVKAS